MPSPFQRTLSRLLLGVALLLTPLLSAQSSPQMHAEVELIADADAAPPGKPLWVGVLFQLDEGWHIYWQNPGDSGEPPKIQWLLPAGYVAGSISWPEPIRLGSSTVVDYGYEGQVLLMAPITGPASGQTLANAGIAADLKYIVCREMCIPGKAHLALVPPPGRSSQWRALFQATRQKLPKPQPPAWRVSAESTKSQFVVSVRGAPPAKRVLFFPLEPEQIDNSSPQEFASNGNGFRLTLRKSEQLLKPISTLRGLIVLEPGSAFEVAVPVTAR